MTKLASVLKDEVSRLVRKELCGGTDALKRASTQYRSDIAALKCRFALLERQLARAGRAGKDSGIKDTQEKSAIRFRQRAWHRSVKLSGCQRPIRASCWGSPGRRSITGNQANRSPAVDSWLRSRRFANWASARSRLGWQSVAE